MSELIEFVKAMVGEAIPGLFGIVAVSLAIFAILVVLATKPEPLFGR
ncbi:MAG: hypothetical protein QGG84_04905 [Rhodospirillales bacterium]|jgi:hypothetical protein|nr:hypothetical protein [Rhodospirillales bacterium]